MGQKVNPIGFRLGINRTWDSRWYADSGYGDLLHEDLKIRRFLLKRLEQAGVAKVVSPEIVRQAFECVRPGGTAVMVGVPPHEADVCIPAQPLFLDRTLMGTFYGAGRPRIDFPWLLDLYADGRLKLDELITRYRPLDEINEAFEDMTNGVAARTILTFD